MSRTRVLLIDDDEDDFVLVRDMLASLPRTQFEVDWCPAYDEALATIAARRHDVYVVDYRLGERTGLDLIRDGFAFGQRPPVILLTGQGDYEIDLEATALGVTDYATKQELNASGLERTIRYAISHHRALHDLARSEERYALAARASNDGIWDWDLKTDRIYFSPRWHAILGRAEPVGEQQPNAWFELVHNDDLQRVRSAIEAHLNGRTPLLQIEHAMRHADGRWRWVLNRGLAIRDLTGTPTRMAGSMADITERRAAELQLQHDALHDALTGLPNRTLLTDRLNQLLQRSIRDPSLGGAVLFVDIDRFKLVNDSLSHALGDQLLIALGARLGELLMPGDTVARLGGDEFVVLLDRVMTEHDAAMVAGRIQSGLGRAIVIGGHELFVTASIGIAMSSPHATAEDLLRNADIAMYDAKRRGGSGYALFDVSMRRRVIDRRARENALRQAVARELIGVHYQPIVELATGRIRGLEALARWPQSWPNVEPLEFIPIAEECGLIKPLGLHVLRTALTALARWRNEGIADDDLSMSVNISQSQLDDPALANEILGVIAAADLPPHTLRLEITESALVHEPERVQRIVSEVCASGVGLHLDDFGTGYSSLSSLRQFPVQALKIDRSFVTSVIGSDSDSDAIVRSTIGLAHGLGLKVIAEGIEHSAEHQALGALGCEYGQGFLFSEPRDAEGTRDLLARWSPGVVAGAREWQTTPR